MLRPESELSDQPEEPETSQPPPRRKGKVQGRSGRKGSRTSLLHTGTLETAEVDETTPNGEQLRPARPVKISMIETLKMRGEALRTEGAIGHNSLGDVEGQSNGVCKAKEMAPPRCAGMARCRQGFSPFREMAKDVERRRAVYISDWQDAYTRKVFECCSPFLALKMQPKTILLSVCTRPA